MATSRMPLSLDATLSAHPYVVSTVHGDDTVLLNATTGRYYTLNAIGGEIWAGVCDEQSLGAIAEQVSVRYGVDAARVGADVLSVARQFVAADLAT